MKNPYLNARRKWRNHMAGLMSSLKMWQAVALASLAITMIAVAGLVHVANQSKFVPVIVHQDRDGNTLTDESQIRPANAADYRTAIASFINNMRLVTPDIGVQRKAITDAYYYISANDPANNKAKEYFNRVDHFALAQTEMISVHVQSVLQQSAHAWQVEWLETVRNRDGTLKIPPYLMRALITVYQAKPDTSLSAAQVLNNPHLIFVRNFNWSRV